MKRGTSSETHCSCCGGQGCMVEVSEARIVATQWGLTERAGSGQCGLMCRAGVVCSHASL